LASQSEETSQRELKAMTYPFASRTARTDMGKSRR